MHDTASRYETVIREFCEVLDLADWPALVRSEHITVGERLVGLIPLPQAPVPTLSVCVELGQTYPERDAALYARMLEANLSRDPGLPGHYALHADSGQAVYLMDLDLDTLTGAEVARMVAQAIATRSTDLGSREG